jgi:hypothetical protein
MWKVWGRREVHTGFRREDLRERDHSVGRGVDGKKILRCVFKK